MFGTVIPRKPVCVTGSVLVKHFNPGRFRAQLRSSRRRRGDSFFRPMEDDAIREWRQEFPEQTRRAISRIQTNLGHPQNSTLAKMISDARGMEEMIKCATRYPCSVCKRMSRPRLRRHSVG